MSLTFRIGIAVLGLVLCGTTVGSAVVVQVDPTVTYLKQWDDFPASGTIPINLAEYGVAPGDRILLERLGGYFNGSDRNCAGMIAVFSSTPEILQQWDVLRRVPGAMDAGAGFVSPPTYWGSFATDIPEDFAIAPNIEFDATPSSVNVQVPQGAAYLFVAALDSFYSDNVSDDFAVQITDTDKGATSEPASILVWGVVAACGVGIGWRRMRNPESQHRGQ